MALNDWMSDYQDRTLAHMHLPGSHDAGTAKGHIDKTSMGTNSNAATQDETITAQLGLGARFFDVRLAKIGWFNKRVVAHHTTAGQGAHSDITVDTVISEAAQFCHDNPSEVVIFRISHTDFDTKVHDIIKANGGNQLHTGTGNLAIKQLKDIVADGNLICILDSGKFGKVINQRQGIHAYTKYGDDPANGQGISCCGCYSGTHKLSDVLTNGLRGQYEHNTNHTHQNAHLWQVYWQKTYVNPVSLQGIEKGAKKDLKIKNGKAHGGTHAATDHMIKLMQGIGAANGEDYVLDKGDRGRFKTARPVMYSTMAVRNFSMPNIISYDFVNAITNAEIIALNNKNVMMHA